MIVVSYATPNSPVSWAYCIYLLYCKMMTGQFYVLQCIPTKCRQISAMPHFQSSPICTTRLTMHPADRFIFQIIGCCIGRSSVSISPNLCAALFPTSRLCVRHIFHLSSPTPHLLIPIGPSVAHYRRPMSHAYYTPGIIPLRVCAATDPALSVSLHSSITLPASFVLS